MVFEKEDIKRIRTKICQLYHDKRIIVAPCRCKLYISRSMQIIDQEGKTSRNWEYFATGVTSLVYDHDAKELMMTLFDVDSLRLLWMLKLNTYSTIQAPTSYFHIVSTSDGRSEHAGLLYENKEVASLLFNTFLLLANRRVPNSQRDYEKCSSRPNSAITGNDKRASVGSQGSQKKRRSKLFRSLSFHGRKSGCTGGMAKSDNRRGRFRSKTLGPEHFTDISKVAASLPRRLSSPEFRHASTKDDDLSAQPDQVVHGCEEVTSNLEPNRMLPGLIKQKILSRRNTEYRSSLKLKQNENTPDATNTQQQSEKRTKSSGLFKRRKVCRTLSEKLPSKPQNITDCEKADHGVTVRCKKSLPKPRSRSDSLLVRGSIVNCIVETGQMAKFIRHRRQWMRSLENDDVNETDLCVTEL